MFGQLIKHCKDLILLLVLGLHLDNYWVEKGRTSLRIFPIKLGGSRHNKIQKTKLTKIRKNLDNLISDKTLQHTNLHILLLVICSMWVLFNGCYVPNVKVRVFL